MTVCTYDDESTDNRPARYNKRLHGKFQQALKLWGVAELRELELL